MKKTDIDGLAAKIIADSDDTRLIVAVAGAPGSGKSTLAEALVERLNAGGEQAAILPMDGFHYDDTYLVPAGLRPRKGAPETFDVGGFASVLRRLRRNEEESVAVPVFDRDIEIARAGARLIPQSLRIIVAEGNYLLLRQGRWPELHDLYDITVKIDVPEEVLRRRLTQRWQHYNLGKDEIAQKLDGNDIPNGRLVRDESTEPDFVIQQG